MGVFRYHIGSFSGQHAYIYLTFIQMFTQTYALYCLVLFGYVRSGFCFCFCF